MPDWKTLKRLQVLLPLPPPTCTQSGASQTTCSEACHRLLLLPLHVHGRDHRALAPVTSRKRVLRTSPLWPRFLDATLCPRPTHVTPRAPCEDFSLALIRGRDTEAQRHHMTSLKSGHRVPALLAPPQHPSPPPLTGPGCGGPPHSRRA